MFLINFFGKESKIGEWKFIFAMAIISGIANATLLGIINVGAEMASNENVNFRFLLMFMVTFLIFYIAKRFALMRATELIEHIMKNVKVRVSNKIRKSELYHLENIGTSLIYTRLTQDTNLISQSATIIINASQSAIMLIFSLLYIFYLSKMAFMITLISIAIAVLMYMSHLKAISEELQQSSTMEANFFESLDSILHGFKELKINSKKSDDLFDSHVNISNSLEKLKIQTGTRFVTDLMFSQVFFYMLIASIIFLLPHFFPIYSEIVIKITTAILFIIGPLEMLVSSLPIFAKANIATQNIYELEDKLNSSKDSSYDEEIEKLTFNEINFKDVTFEYFDLDNKPLFAIKPINFTLKKGELIFVVGGNGSGKSTFIKLLTGLYYPNSGSIFVDDEEVDKNSYQSYREFYSIILTDFYLFKKLYGLGEIEVAKMKELLKEMGLFNKTKFTKGAFTNTNLSTGQKKRLALITTLLEDKDIYVFDEWAADQDPTFRKYFYEVILKELKERGKTVIAVTHDDHYFHVADRVVKMEYGKMVEE